MSDIHANLLALDRALALVDQEPAPIVILGDLLTYGPDPRAVLERLASRQDQVVHWLLGNHDELYLALLQGRPAPMLADAPGWLRSSIEWTLSQIDDLASWFCGLPFTRETTESGILLAHANPFGDWRYLDSDEDCRDAARTLARRGLSVAVFGHTHRERFFTEPPRSRARACQLTWGPREGAEGPEVRIVNAGSVGQPRRRNSPSTVLRLQGSGRTGQATHHAVEYDVAQHLERVARLPLAPHARDRLASLVAWFVT